MDNINYTPKKLQSNTQSNTQSKIQSNIQSNKQILNLEKDFDIDFSVEKSGANASFDFKKNFNNVNTLKSNKKHAELFDEIISDINIHLEIPVFSAISWGHTNIIVVNPEQWSYSYDAYVHAFDALIFRDSNTAELFRKDFTEKGIRTDNIYVVPWCASWQVKDIKGVTEVGVQEFVCFLAGSSSKYEYLKKIPIETYVPNRLFQEN
jgi:hypothetical protein